jgi:hypothetical protein
MNRICKGDGECLEQCDENNYIKDSDVTCNHDCIPIKCKNYILCNTQFPEMYIGCWGGEGLCRNCDMIFGKELNINNNIECNNCLENTKCVLYLNQILCIECFKKNYYTDCNSDSETQDEAQVDWLNLNEIEKFMYDTYLLNYKSKQLSSTCSLNNKKYIIDKLKLDNLSFILPFELNKVELKKSNIHGYGVFAKQQILKNELITFYPGDFVEYYPNADGAINNHITTVYRSERYENQFGNNIHSDISKKYRNNDYRYDINEHYSIIGCSYFKDDSNYLGHFINDGAKTNSTEKSNKIYIKISSIKNNCNFYSLKDLHIAIIAIKDIEIGEELFIRYGIGYWNSYNKNTIK